MEAKCITIFQNKNLKLFTVKNRLNVLEQKFVLKIFLNSFLKLK